MFSPAPGHASFTSGTLEPWFVARDGDRFVLGSSANRGIGTVCFEEFDQVGNAID